MRFHAQHFGSLAVIRSPALEFIFIGEHTLQIGEQTVHHIFILVVPGLPQQCTSINEPIFTHERMEQFRFKSNCWRFPWELVSEGHIEFELAVLVETLPHENNAVPYYMLRAIYFCSSRDWGWRRLPAVNRTSATSC